ncbi:putative GroES-like superfamily, polyketide synthase, enoylreductase domain-containing protein [Plasmopara halstedii]
MITSYPFKDQLAVMQSRKIVCHKLSTNFRECTAIVAFTIPELKQGEVLMQTKYCGVNASDINYTNGIYLPGVLPPFDCGFEALGIVLEVGPGVSRLKKGDAVVFTSYGAFSEHIVAKERSLVKVPVAIPEVLPITLCGLTASIALEHVGEMKHGETVLVTAAAGATGQFAVQLAKLAGNHVIGTCSSPEKVEYLHSIGCDRPINYRSENVFHVLKNEYPRGVDLVFESVGGEMFQTCVDNIARKGRIIVIGAIAGYQDSSSWKQKLTKPEMPLPSKLLARSASVRGFLYNDYLREIHTHTKKLTTLVQRGVLKAGVDPSNFCGLEDIPNAIDHMYECKNIGKIIVDISKGTSRL